jgi:hypothetical protein
MDTTASNGILMTWLSLATRRVLSFYAERTAILRHSITSLTGG